MTADIRFLNIGTTIRRTIRDQDGTVIDISAATDTYFYFRRPDGTVFRVDAAFTTDGSDGNIEYTTEHRDLDMPGLWKLQARIIEHTPPAAPDYDLWTNEWEFDVMENLEQGVRLLSGSFYGTCVFEGDLT